MVVIALTVVDLARTDKACVPCKLRHETYGLALAASKHRIAPEETKDEGRSAMCHWEHHLRRGLRCCSSRVGVIARSFAGKCVDKVAVDFAIASPGSPYDMAGQVSR